MLHRIKAPLGSVALLLICLLSFPLRAGETGKIAGSVKDKQNGQSLPGANVMITAVWQGDRVAALERPTGAVSDTQGQYFILNLPPGYYNVRISYIGYIQQLHEKVQVKIDKTTRLDFALEATALAGEQVVVTAYRPDKVEKDLTATKLTYDVGEVISIAGVESIADILELQADVVDDHFRGGRVGESTYLIGGAAIVNPLSNERAFLPIVTALEQVEVYTSGFSAEYGNAQSGVVNMVAKEGKSSWDSRMEFSSTLPYYKSWGGSPYSPENLDYFHLLYDPEEWLKDNPLLPGHPLWENGYGVAKYLPPRIVWPPNPLNHQDSLRMALIGRNLWLQSVRDVGLESRAMDYRFDFTAGGPVAKNTQMFVAMRQSMISPLVPTPNPDLERQMLGNLTWQPSADDKLKLSVMYDFSFLNYLDSNWERWIFDRTLSVTKKTNSSLQYGLEWRHLFSPASYGDFNFKVLDVRQRDRIELLTDDQYLDDYGNNRNWVDYTAPSNQRVGRPNDDRGSQKTRTWSLTSSYTSQINRYNLLKSGLQFYYYDLDVDYQYNATNPQNLQNLTFRSFPFEGALYLQDKMEFEGLIANIGLRFDFYDLNTRYYLDKFYPLRDPEKTEKTGLFTRLQPRIGISFPVSEYSVFHLNYGTFTQRPNFYQLFYNEINDDGGIVTLYTLGNPELKPENTQAYDIGIVRSLAGGFQIDVSAYYKDVKNLVESAFYKTEGGESYRTYINRDYADIKGFHVNFERVTGSLRGYLRYNYEEAKGKNSNPDNLAVPVTFFNYTPSEEELADLAEQRFPEDVFLDYDRKHKMVINLRYLTGKESGFEILGFRPLANLSVSNTFRYYTGRPYTLPPSLDPFGQALKFSKRTPDERDWRIRLEKRFGSGRSSLTAYVEGFNMLNQKTWSYSRTFNHGRNTVRWHTDRANILTDDEFAPYVTGQELYLLTNEPRHFRMGMIFHF
ncbi:MAG TPA: TonB-dependent receptor [bacterium]|nr:TonB-dependent receptor [bacterium]HOH06159.1 TonB-dependent receptor [bacterium]HOY43220.1 TonB-dependent receptor [bacterium]HPG82836.1 TonB-dependent receptor [bacterium]